MALLTTAVCGGLTMHDRHALTQSLGMLLNSSTDHEERRSLSVADPEQSRAEHKVPEHRPSWQQCSRIRILRFFQISKKKHDFLRFFKMTCQKTLKVVSKNIVLNQSKWVHILRSVNLILSFWSSIHSDYGSEAWAFAELSGWSDQSGGAK